MLQLLEQNLHVWVGTCVLALLTLLSDKILGRIRIQLNRADLRTKYYEELARDLSTYLFYASIFEERFRRGWADDQGDLEAVTGAVNGAITALMTKEFVYRSWAKRYWSPAAAESLQEALRTVQLVDEAIHDFNDPEDVPAKLAALGEKLSSARQAVESWLARNDT